MARRHFVSALGGMGKLGIRRAAIYFLSAGIVDGWSRVRFYFAVEIGARRVHLARPGSRGIFDVAILARISAPRGSGRRGSAR